MKLKVPPRSTDPLTGKPWEPGECPVCQPKIGDRACDSCGKVAPSAEEAEAHGLFLDTVLTVTDDGRTVVETETRCPVCW